MVTTTEILAVIGGTTLVLTAAARVPAALAEFLRACILVASAARELRAALASPVRQPEGGDTRPATHPSHVIPVTPGSLNRNTQLPHRSQTRAAVTPGQSRHESL